jgi:hypothetical protein
MVLIRFRRSVTPSLGFSSFQNHNSEDEVVVRPKSIAGSSPQHIVDGASIEQRADNPARSSILSVPSPSILHKTSTKDRDEYPSSSPTILRSKFTNHHREPPKRRQRPAKLTAEKTGEETAETVLPSPESTTPDLLYLKLEPREIQYCSVCSEDFTAPETVVRAAGGCSHRTKTCGNCTSLWIASQLETVGWEYVRCPECPQLLSYDDIRLSASKQVFHRYKFMLHCHIKYLYPARYEKLVVRATLSAIPSFRWCIGPGCESGQIHEAGTNSPIMRCVLCGFKTCVQHETKWHDGETCKEYDDRVNKREEEKKANSATMQLIFDTTKRCPGTGCIFNIEKNQGCSHMTCTLDLRC